MYFVSICSHGGSDKQHLDSSDESDMDTPMHNNSSNNSTTQSQPNPTAQQSAQHQQHQLHLGLSSSVGGGGQQHHHSQQQHGHHVSQGLHSPGDGGSGLLVANSNLSHNNSSSSSTIAGLSSQGKNIGQMPALSAVAYSHLHSVMGAGSMPLYDISDYQHL